MVEARRNFLRRMGAFVLAACCVLALDQVTKALVRAYFSTTTTPVTLVPGVMELKFVRNTGAAFSIGEGASFVFVIVALLVVAAAAVYVWRTPEESPVCVVALGCVAGGGIGNLVDRVAFGWVTDFLATTFINFPVFNVADSFITCGIIVALIVTLREERQGLQRG